MFANVPHTVLSPARARVLLILAVLLAVLAPTAPGALAAGKPDRHTVGRNTAHKERTQWPSCSTTPTPTCPSSR
ncbi:hypothetical protein ABZ038_29670, partial [Streptomyces sp. NPDC006349]